MTILHPSVNQPLSASTVERILLVPSPNHVSVVIPHFYASRRPNVDALIANLRLQTYPNIEVLIIHKVSPQGRAINTGARAAQGDVIMVFDDDATFDQRDLVERLLAVLKDHPDVGMAGASIISPENINAFQRSAAKQFPRFHMPVVETVTDSDMPCHGCVIFPRAVFEKVGMERDDILRGLDPDLRVRIRSAGYRVVLVPNTRVYHPFPETIGKFTRLFFRNGYGSAYIQTFHPEINYDTDEAVDSKKFVPKRSFIYRLFRFPLRLLQSLFSLRLIRLLGYSVYALGYAWGGLKFNLYRITGRTPKL